MSYRENLPMPVFGTIASGSLAFPTRLNRRCVGVLLLIASIMLMGCVPAEQEPPAVEPTVEHGRLQGRVWWGGPVPQVPPINAALIGPKGEISYRDFPNPNAPQIDSAVQTVTGAIVMLESAPEQTGTTWNHPPVRVEIDTEQIHIIQGDAEVSNIGIIRTGDEVEFVSRDAALHVLSVRGAAFFGLAFPDPNRPLRRRFTKPGLVELSSGASKYWHRAYLWVCSHPYITRTDHEGRYQFDDVPSGTYQLRAWLPNHRLAGTDLDPNTGMVMRQHFAPPLQSIRDVTIPPDRTIEFDCLLIP